MADTQKNTNRVPPRQEDDTLLLGWRVALALFAENEPLKKQTRSQAGRVDRRYVTVRARAIQAAKGR